MRCGFNQLLTIRTQSTHYCVEVTKGGPLGEVSNAAR